MRVNGEAIYGTTASPYGLPAWGRYTTKASKVYAHVFEWPKDHRLRVTGARDKPSRAYLLANGKPLVVAQTDGDFVVELPAVPPSTIASVVVLETSTRRAQR